MKLLNYPPISEITKLSLNFMKLSNCPYLLTMTRVQSTTTRSLILIVLTSVSPIVPVAAFPARRQRRIELPKPELSDGRSQPKQRFWCSWGWGEIKIQAVASPKAGGIDGEKRWVLPRLSELERQCSGPFSALITVRIWWPASNLPFVPCSASEVTRNGRSDWVGSRVRVGSRPG